jgi:hypothetical protein
LSEGCEPLISKQDARLHYRLGWVASPGALPRERFSSLAHHVDTEIDQEGRYRRVTGPPREIGRTAAF